MQLLRDNLTSWTEDIDKGEEEIDRKMEPPKERKKEKKKQVLVEVSKELYFQEFDDGPIAAGSEKKKKKKKSKPIIVEESGEEVIKGRIGRHEKDWRNGKDEEFTASKEIRNRSEKIVESRRETKSDEKNKLKRELERNDKVLLFSQPTNLREKT